MINTPQPNIPLSNQDDRRLTFTAYRDSRTPAPCISGAVAWDKLIEKLKFRDIREHKEGPAFSFVRLKPGTIRGSANVEALSAAVLDIDDGTPFETLISGISDLEYCAYSTHTHIAAHPKYRVILPLSREVTGAEWLPIWKAANRLIGAHADPSAKDAARLYFFPSCPAERQADAFHRHNVGAWLDPDGLLASAAGAVSRDVTAVNWTEIQGMGGRATPGS